jgi:K+-sensing histidine kinase KdpD
VRAAAGSLFHVPVVRNAPAEAIVSHLQRRGARVLAMDPDAEDDLYLTDLSGPVAFIFGNESQGLPPAVRSSADACVRIPHSGRAESLNLAAAATLCLFEWARQHRASVEPLGSLIISGAHDIRSPLTAMRGFGFALEEHWDEMSVEQRKLMLSGIVYDAEKIDLTLRQLVDAARVVEGRFEALPERTDVAALVSEISATLARDPEHPPIAWTGQEAVAFVDPGRLRTVLHAFIESVVWWGLDGPVAVRARVDPERLQMAVSRNGTELRAEEAEDLFLARRAAEGESKIGLYVARSVIEAMSGRAWGDVVDDRLVLHLELPAM